MIAHEIADRYPLTPLQQGMLYHALSAPRSGVDIEQLVCTLRETVDAARLRSAWEQVVARHAILRTTFRWDSAPVQEVAARVELPWSEDFSVISESSFAKFLHEDRAAGFEMDHAPLLRLRLFRFGSAEFRLVWTFHHALLDGRSFPIVLRDVFAIYDGAAPRPEPRPYREFIDWLQTRDHTASENFWRKALAGFTAPTPIPVEHLGDCATQPEQGDADASLDRTTTTRLRTLSDTHGFTLNTLVQGAWALVLSRYSGEEDIVFGATRACRRGSLEGADTIAGLFINTLPIRVRVSSDAKLIPWLVELRAQWIAMRPHEHTPLASIHAWTSVPGGKPLFDTIVVFENYDLNTTLRSQGGPWLNRDFRLYEQTNFALTLAAYSGDELRLRIEFDRQRFDDATIRRLLGHLTTLLEAFAANPDRALGELPLLTTVEHHRLIHEWTERSPVATPEKTLHQLFHEQAARTPDAIAVRCDGAQLTYAELDRRAAQLAHHLRTLEVGPEIIAGLCVERSIDLIVGVLGILKAGGAYLPIDLAYPPERLAFMLADAQAPVVITQRHLVDRLPQHGARIVCIDDFTTTSELHDPGTPGSLAYIIYTSGSTGQPKGCCITHRNVVRLMAATHPWFGFDARDVWTMFHSIAFDFSVWEIWGALLYGGRLIVVPHEISRSPDAFVELVEREGVTVLNQTPSAFRQFIAADTVHRSPITDHRSLRLVIFGGEALEMQSLRPWFDRHGDTQPQLVNMYGITETTVHVTYRPLSASDVQRGSVIGVPIPDLEILILDSAQRPVPIGVPGEMFVGGAGLARGYLRRDELTAQRFIPHPWRAGERLYRTGDLARWLPDRDIEYLGRIDQQVKIRGFRIELGEIESVLVQHPAVREAVVVARDQRLVAYVVGNVPANELRAHLKTKLPDYMVPAAFVAIERVPLTNNGKTDLRSLPDPEPERPETGAQFLAPRTRAEETLAAIWRRVLRLERVGVNDNFFDLGGDSILSILVVAQSRQAGLTITPKLIFDHPTIADLVEHAAPRVPSPSEAPATGNIPLTPIQRWFFEQNFAKPNHWNQALVFKLSSPIPHEELGRAIHEVAQRHDAFRLRFTHDETGWHQHLAESPAVACETAPATNDAAAHAGIDITHGPLLRVVQTLDPSPRLLIIAHHLVIDGVSWRVLMEDLDAALARRALAAPTTSFTRWAQLLKVAADAAALRDELPHWHAVATAAQTDLPLDLSGGENSESSAQTIRIALSTEETATFLRQRANDVLLAALARVFGSDFIVDVEGHGREDAELAELSGTHADLSHTIGWFTSIFPQRLGGEAAPRRGFGYGLLRHIAGLAPQPRAAVLFNYLGQFDAVLAPESRFALDEFSTTGWHGPRNSRTHLVEINCIVIAGRLEARWTYSENLHRRETVALWAESFREALVQQIASRSSLPLSPIQQLYYTLESAQPGAGFDQWHGKLRGSLDVDRYQRAWQTVLDRHAALRTSFHSTSGEARQHIHPCVHLEWQVADWRGAFTDARFAAFLSDDRRRSFDLTHPPLTRLALLHVAEDEWRIVWSHHHLQIDGWSWPIVLREVAAAYRGSPLPPAPDYTAYLDWLSQRPAHVSADFWRAHLGGFREPTPLPCECIAGSERSDVLNAAFSQQLRDTARTMRVTVNTLAQAAWALLLAQRAGRKDVVFGASFSGRPADLPGVENIVGPMVGNLPVRATIDPAAPLETLLRQLHEQSFAFHEHQYTPLPQIHACSALPWHARIFDTLLVFQNYVTGDNLMIEELVAPIQTNYPLTLVVTPGPQIALSLIGAREPAEMLGWFRDILTGLTTGKLPTIPQRAAAPASPRRRSTNFLAARSALEKQIAAVWCEAFSADEIGIRDNFFDLGGHSLLMLRVHARLREVLKRDISIVQMFQHPTIESLARHLDGSTTPAARVTAAQERAARQRAAFTRKP